MPTDEPYVWSSEEARAYFNSGGKKKPERFVAAVKKEKSKEKKERRRSGTGKAPRIVKYNPETDYEEMLFRQIKDSGRVPVPLRQKRFHPKRRWLFDFAWPNWGDRVGLPGVGLVVEVEGGLFIRGRHVRPEGFTNDAEKYNEALLRRWVVMRVVPDWVKSGRALDYIERAFKVKY